MTPAAQLHAALDVVSELLEAWHSGKRTPADSMLQQYVRARRYIGSKDRRAISTLFYTTLRRYGIGMWLCEQQQLPPTARHIVLATQPELAPLFGTGHYAPAALTDAETQLVAHATHAPDAPAWAHANMPEWLHSQLRDDYGDDAENLCHSLQQEAPLVLRTNTLKTTRDTLLQQLRAAGIEAAPTYYSPWGIVVSQRIALGDLPAYRNGLCDVQDESSQLAVLACGAQPGMRVIDVCAGAGGKALALAAAMHNRGQVLAVDVVAKRLAEAHTRAERAGASIIQTQCIAPDAPYPTAWHGTADVVLVDAPCTGTGTIRRNPDLAWRLQPEDAQHMHHTQLAILARAVALLKPNGRLIYSTCSLLKAENEHTVTQLLNKKLTRTLALEAQIWNKDCVELNGSARIGVQLSPHTHGTDGFYLAAMTAK